MPIIHMGSRNADSYPEGAYCPFGPRSENSKVELDRLATNGVRGGMVLYTTHHGLCIRDYEQNGYNDSDWFMVVWNPEEKKPETILFASTRGWTYPCYASAADATPEVMAEYEAYQEAVKQRHLSLKRKARAKALRAVHTNLRKVLTGQGAIRLQALRHTLGEKTVENLVWLLTAKIRSSFKKSLRDQVILWTQDPAPRYPTPLSRKQLGYLNPGEG